MNTSMDDVKSIINFISNININKYISEVDEINKNILDISSKQNYFEITEYKSLIYKKNKIEKIIDIYKTIKTYLDKYYSTLNLIEDENEDEEIKNLAIQELEEIKSNLKIYYDEIEVLFQKELPNDNKSAIFEIRPGVGGIESCLFANDLFEMYIKYVTKNNYKYSVYNIEYNEEGGINLVTFEIHDFGSYKTFRFESGVHRVQRIPKTESSGRIHTSTSTVVVLPKFEINDFKLDPKEIRIDVYRSGGPGGQSVNTTDSAVRITHIPTNIVVTCQNSRSQHQNKETAMSVLYSKLKQLEINKVAENQRNLKSQYIQNSERSSKIRTYNFPQSRVTDHRLNYTWYNIDEIMNGEINDILVMSNRKLRNLEQI